MTVVSRRDGHVVVVPVKRLAQAKSRVALGSRELRHELALAFSLDTLDAVRRCPGVRAVVVVTDEPQIRRRCLGRHGWIVADDAPSGLNAAIRRGAAVADALHPGTAVAAVMADLPTLRPEELAEALDEAGRHAAAYVADTDGSGTTLLAARRALDLTPCFGPDSARRHDALGAVPVAARVPTLRRDVDTLDDIRLALAMGVGRWTRRAGRNAADAMAMPPAHAVP